MLRPDVTMRWARGRIDEAEMAQKWRAGLEARGDGHLNISDAPGLGAELNHEVARAHLSTENRFLALFQRGWETRGRYGD